MKLNRKHNGPTVGGGPKRRAKIVKADPVGDVTLASYADANLPLGCKRVSKSTAVFPFSPFPEDIETVLDDDELLEIRRTEEAKKCTISFDVWYLLSKYVSPEDVLSFSLICRTTYDIVNTIEFWVRLYDRYYSAKLLPPFLEKKSLQRTLGLKANVIRSLYYTYTPFRNSLKSTNRNMQSLLGCTCECMSVRSVQEENTQDDCDDNWFRSSGKWLYSFMLRNRAREVEPNFETVEDTINHNPDNGSRLLEIVARDYIHSKCVNGMKLRKVSVEYPYVCLVFSSTPLSRDLNYDCSAINLHLRPEQPPSICSWWQPHFSEKTRRQNTSTQ